MIYKTQITLMVKDLSISNIAKNIYQEVGNTQIDVIVNNAGFGLFGTFYDTDWERESEMLHLHILTTTHLIKLFLPDMIERGSGKDFKFIFLGCISARPINGFVLCI